jgi:hypothetical protein
MNPYQNVQIGHDEGGYYFIWILSDGTVIDLGVDATLQAGLSRVIADHSLFPEVRQAFADLRNVALSHDWRYSALVEESRKAPPTTAYAH